MKVIVPGHIYHLTQLDVDPKKVPRPMHILTFVKREGEGYPGNDGHHHGTTTQEVLRALIDRAQYVDRQIHDDRNDEVIHHLREAILLLEQRAAERHGRPALNYGILNGIERMIVCSKCGHIGCLEDCHE